MKDLHKYVLERVESIQDREIHGDWKLGFTTAYLIQRFYLNQNRTLDEIKSIDPWKFEPDIESLYEQYIEMNLIDCIDVGEIMESFVDCWFKTEHTDLLEKSWFFADQQLKDLDRSTLKAKSKADDKLIRRICELMSMESGVFYLPTRKLGELMKKNRNYPAIKLKRLVKEGFLLEVQKGNQRQSPRFKVNPDYIENQN